MSLVSSYDSDEDRWKAVCESDLEADGMFYYAVLTTGVYCRPSCSSRIPKRANVKYFKTGEHAEAHGYRPCKRCHPGTASKRVNSAQKIVRACRYIEQSDRGVSLQEVADTAGMSKSHFHRLFKKILGVTPRQYAANYRSQRFREELETSPSVTDAIYRAGYSSSSRAYDKKQDQIGMGPKVYRKGAAGLQICYGLAPCFLGWIIVAATERGICAVELGDDPDTLPLVIQERFPLAAIGKAAAGFRKVIESVIAFIEKPATGFDLPLDIQGTVFQQRVWAELRRIKPGEKMSYSEVAERIGNPKGVRAVASACGANKLAVIIPCHRVVSKDGTLSGYRWGVERKKLLLDSECNEVRDI